MKKAKRKFTVIRVSGQVFNMTRRITWNEDGKECTDTFTIPFLSMSGAIEWCHHDAAYYMNREGIGGTPKGEYDSFGNFCLMVKNERKGFYVEYFVEAQYLRVNGKWNDPTIPVRYDSKIF